MYVMMCIKPGGNYNGGVPVHQDPSCGWDWGKPRKMTMGAAPAPILDFRGLPQSCAWGHGELGPPHPCRMEAGFGSDDLTRRNICPDSSICYIYSGIKYGKEWLY